MLGVVAAWGGRRFTLTYCSLQVFVDNEHPVVARFVVPEVKREVQVLSSILLCRDCHVEQWKKSILLNEDARNCIQVEQYGFVQIDLLGT